MKKGLANTDGEDSKYRSQENTGENPSRRTVLRTAGTGIVGAAGVGLVEAGAVDATAADRVSDRTFDPFWTTQSKDAWRESYDVPMQPEEKGVLINRHLHFNEVRQGRHDNLFSFHLDSIGAMILRRDDGEHRGLGAAKSDHTFEIESDDIDVRDISTTLPRIANAFSGPEDDESIPIEEVPEREDNWTTDKADLESADISESDGDESVILGGASIAVGLAAGVPASGGAAALLAGSSAVLGLAGIYSGMGDYGEEVKSTESIYRYNGKTKHHWGPFGIFTEVPPSDVFTHHMTIDVPVKHGESATFEVRDKIKPTGHSFDADEWLDTDDHSEGYWEVTIPEYSEDEDPATAGLPYTSKNSIPLM